ncbi:MAG: tetratricopeptide repeat protein [Bryobacteraceae bacterium]
MLTRERNTLLATLVLTITLIASAQNQETACDSQRSASAEASARAALKSGDAPLAVRWFQQALDACPDNRRLLLSMAETQIAGRDFENAIRNATLYLQGDRPSFDGRLILAKAYFLAQRLKESLAESELVLKQDPQEPSALKLKANAAYLLGDPATAKDTFIRLLDKHPEDEEGAYMLGRIYYQEGATQLAVGQFERALKLNRSSYKALDNLGLCYQALGENDKAIRYHLTAIKLVETAHPDYEWPYINLAEALLKTGDAQHAFDSAAKATKRNPMTGHAFYVGAKALDQLGKPDLAVNWLERATALDTGDTEAWYLLARLYRKQGQTERAEAALHRFQELKAKEPAKRR